MKIFIIMILFSFSVFSDTDCTPGHPLPSSQHKFFTDARFHACPKEITYNQYTKCVKDPVYRGGLMDAECDIGNLVGCCYQRTDGRPKANWEKIRCEKLMKYQPSVLDDIKRLLHLKK